MRCWRCCACRARCKRCADRGVGGGEAALLLASSSGCCCWIGFQGGSSGELHILSSSARPAGAAHCMLAVPGCPTCWPLPHTLPLLDPALPPPAADWGGVCGCGRWHLLRRAARPAHLPLAPAASPGTPRPSAHALAGWLACLLASLNLQTVRACSCCFLPATFSNAFAAAEVLAPATAHTHLAIHPAHTHPHTLHLPTHPPPVCAGHER